MTRRDQARCAQLACERKATEVSQELRRGMFGLQAIAASAFLLGVFFANYWLLTCFGSGSGEKYTIVFNLMGCMGRSLRPVVFGLAVAIPAALIATYIRSRAEEFEVEMRSAGLQLENYLLLYQNDRGNPSTCSAT